LEQKEWRAGHLFVSVALSLLKGSWSPHDREIPLRIEVPRNRSRNSKKMLQASWVCDQ
jgi:hypothetical protein